MHGQLQFDEIGDSVVEGIFHTQALAVWSLEAGLHHDAVRDDVEATALGVADLILRFADNDLDDRSLHQPHLPRQEIQALAEALPHIRVSGGGQLRFFDENGRFHFRELRFWPLP